MLADILYRKGFIHIFPADIILDQKDRGIFFFCIIGRLEKLFCFFYELLMKIVKGKNVLQSVHKIFLMLEKGEL